MIFDRRERAILRIGPPGLDVAGARSRILIVIHQDLQMRAFGADIGRLQTGCCRQLLLDVKVPFVSYGRMQPGIVAGYACEFGLTDVERRKTSGNRQDGRNAVAHEAGLKEERKVVAELQRVACADFLIAEKPAVAGADHSLAALERAPGQADARSKVIFVGGHQAVGCAILSGDDNLAVAKSKLLWRSCASVIGRGVVVAEPQIQSERWRHFEVVLNESAIGVLAVSEIRQSGDNGCRRDIRAACPPGRFRCRRRPKGRRP